MHGTIDKCSSCFVCDDILSVSLWGRCPIYFRPVSSLAFCSSGVQEVWGGEIRSYERAIWSSQASCSFPDTRRFKTCRHSCCCPEGMHYEKFDASWFPMTMSRSYVSIQLSSFTKVHSLCFIQPGYMLYDRVLRPAEVGVTVVANNVSDQSPEAWGVDLQLRAHENFFVLQNLIW